MDELIERLRAKAESLSASAAFSRRTTKTARGAADKDLVADLLREAAAALEVAREDVSTERRALMWLSGRDSGMSSVAICHHMLGMKSDGSFPWDPADLGRCLRLLERFPEWKPRIGEMARYSHTWAALAARWDELAAMMENEVGIDGSKGKRAPLTYAAMNDAIDQARGKGGCGEGVA